MAGAIGGAFASFIMNQFQAGTSKLFENSGQPRKAERDRAGQSRLSNQNRAAPAGADERADVKTAVLVSENVFHHELQPAEKEWAAELVHYSYGTGIGALYGAMAEHWEDTNAGEGAAFGAVLWLVSDEVAVPALRLSKGPQEYPLRTHAMALASHLVYGVTTELTRRFLRSGVLSR